MELQKGLYYLFIKKYALVSTHPAHLSCKTYPVNIFQWDDN